jgi:uncharacterized protein
MLPLAHILAGFSLGIRHRAQLGRVLAETPADARILNLDPAVLKAEGISVLALDFAGVLAPHGLAVPTPEAHKWLLKAAAVFGQEKLFILSNKPTEQRKEWFASNFPGLRFISGVAKKPFPDGLMKISELSGVPLSRILMVDDRLLTGCLAAINAGAVPYYVRRPYVSLRGNTFAELFFMSLRFAERIFISLIS